MTDKKQINEYGEIINSEYEESTLSSAELLKDVPTVNFEKDLGLRKPTTYEKVHTYFARKYAPLILDLKDKFRGKVKNKK